MSPEAIPPRLDPLSQAERETLLRLARESIRTALAGLDLPSLAAPAAALRAHAGVFVSLHDREQLRGCVGNILGEHPLYENVARMARSAAFDDPRFAPLTADELAAVSIEISRLSELVPAHSADIVPGVHGIYLKEGEHRAVFLPQVATHHHWDRDTLLRQLCLKALLPDDAWTRPDVRLMIFVAEVFSDAEETATLS